MTNAMLLQVRGTWQSAMTMGQPNGTRVNRHKALRKARSTVGTQSEDSRKGDSR